MVLSLHSTSHKYVISRGLLVDRNQILQTYILRIVWQTVRRIINEICEWNGLDELQKPLLDEKTILWFGVILKV